MSNRVFLGGTCNNSAWRDDIIESLLVGYFDPVVEDWTPLCQALETSEKAYKCNIHLYVITSDMTGVFSIAEVIESAMTPGKHTIFHVLPGGFSAAQLKSLGAVVEMVIKHGGVAYVDEDLLRTARVLNNCFQT